MPACPGVAAFLKSKQSSSPSRIWCWRTACSEVAGQKLFYPSRDGHREHTIQSPALQQTAVEVLQSFNHVNRVCLQTSKSPSVPSITIRVSTGCLACYQKMVCTHKSKLVQKLSKDNDGVTFVLRGEIRNRYSLIPANIHPSDRRTRVASCKWNDIFPSLK